MARTRTTYRQVIDGAWITVPRRLHKLRCCDCGLVHRVLFRTGAHGRTLQFQAVRDERATAQVRRHAKKVASSCR